MINIFWRRGHSGNQRYSPIHNAPCLDNAYSKSSLICSTHQTHPGQAGVADPYHRLHVRARRQQPRSLDWELPDGRGAIGITEE